MAQLGILFPSAERWDVHHHSERRSYRVDPHGFRDDRQGFWLGVLAQPGGGGRRNLCLGNSSQAIGQPAITDIVGAVRAPDRTLLGYVGVSVLVERIGRRLSAIEFSDRLLFEVLDQNGVALFASDFKPNPVAPAPKAYEGLISEINQSKSGHFERNGNLYSFSPIESSGWVAVVEQPRTLAYKPVHDLLGR